MAAHSYWRIYVAQGVGAYVGIYQLDFQDAAGVSLVSGGSAFAISTYGPYTADKPFPPSNTYWIANNLSTGYIGYHFAAPVTVDRVVIAGYGPCPDSPNQPTVLQLEYSDDNVTWVRDWIITRPLAGWTFGAAITCLRPTLATSAPYWAFHLDTTQPGGADLVAAELRFLDASGTAIGGFSNMGGSLCAGGQPWTQAWDNNLLTSARPVSGGPPNPIIGYAQYPAPVLVRGLSFTSDHDIFFGNYSPATGSVWSGVDGNTWGKIFDIDPSNATNYPVVGAGQTVTWNAPLLTGNLYRRAMLLS
jgi:hypothetical protein